MSQDRSQEKKLRLGISSCLLGEHVRYDAGHKLDHYLADVIGNYVEWAPVCPEVEYGLSIPREPMRLVGDPAHPRLVTTRTGIDHTEGMLEWAEKRVRQLEKMELCGFVFKAKSPSSGMQGVKVYGASGVPSKKGVGMFARVFMEHFPLLPVEDEGRLHDSALRENFIERIFICKRWREFEKSGGTIKDLISFHTDHKLLILAHSPKHYTALGRMVAHAKDYTPEKLKVEYIAVLMEGLRLIATVKKNTNVLEHIIGYFKKQLTSDEKQELLEVIEHYHRELIPLIVPITLINHYVRKFDEPYLKRQYYLNPHPLELMLRNHV